MRPPTKPKRPVLTPDQVIDIAATSNLAVNTVKRWLRGDRVRASTHNLICLALVSFDGASKIKWVAA